MQENLKEMLNTLNKPPETPSPEVEENITPTPSATTEPTTGTFSKKLKLINFFDWYENHNEMINDVSRVKAEVSHIDSKDSFIFKVPKSKNNEEMELVSFYNPGTRPILNIPPVSLRVFKNDTFQTLHPDPDGDTGFYFKSYGVKTGLIVVICLNVDGLLIPVHKKKVKKDVNEIEFILPENTKDSVLNKMTLNADTETVQLLYKQIEKVKEPFTTNKSIVEWFLKRQNEVNDINHLLKIDQVLISLLS